MREPWTNELRRPTKLASSLSDSQLVDVAGRPTLVCGGPGCGKTLLAATFLVRGAIDHGEPGVFMSFDERIADLGVNVASLGFDLPELEPGDCWPPTTCTWIGRRCTRPANMISKGLFVRLNPR